MNAVLATRNRCVFRDHGDREEGYPVDTDDFSSVSAVFIWAALVLIDVVNWARGR